MSDFRLDWNRKARTGIAEAVLCEGKTPAQIASILEEAGDRRLLLTRLSQEMFETLPSPHRAALDHDALSCTGFYGSLLAPDKDGPVIVCAGTSDLPVAREAARCLMFSGYHAPVIADVGVAGLWRLLERIDEIRTYQVVIAVAGMEGALFSVLGGMLETPIIAVPTSIGYGIAVGGWASLSSALASCASGLVAVNIDNGFGAACAAIRVMRLKDNSKAEPMNY